MSTERLLLCAIWDVPFAHQATFPVQFGTSLLHISEKRQPSALSGTSGKDSKSTTPLMMSAIPTATTAFSGHVK